MFRRLDIHRWCEGGIPTGGQPPQHQHHPTPTPSKYASHTLDYFKTYVNANYLMATWPTALAAGYKSTAKPCCPAFQQLLRATHPTHTLPGLKHLVIPEPMAVRGWVVATCPNQSNLLCRLVIETDTCLSSHPWLCVCVQLTPHRLQVFRLSR